MKKFLLTLFALSSLHSYGQIFSQNFTGVTTETISSIVNSSTPTASQFTYISAAANTPTSINNGQLRFTKNGSASAAFTRNASFNATFLLIKFKFTLSGTYIAGGTTNIHARFFVGDNFTNNVTAPTDAQQHSMFAFHFVTPTEGVPNFKLRSKENDGDLSENLFAGQQEITFAVNNTGNDVIYIGPDGNTKTLGNDKSDLWVGNTPVFAGTDAVSGSVPLNNFKFVMPTAAQNGVVVDFDDFVIYSQTVLPVSLISFTGKKDGKASRLSWETASEKDNSHFEILRAGDDGKFTILSTLKGNGTTQQQTTYTFTDYNPLLGNNYYKIRQIDTDGTVTEYSIIVSVYYGNNSSLYVVKKAGTGYITVNVFSSKTGTDYLNVADVNGRLFYREQIRLQSGQNSIQIPDNFQQRGIYVVKVAGQNLATKFIK